eukprot:m.53419 g.53419  ORF g.53419 m.53419 type:complete len:209 (+) comp34249_c0_seq1:36-662(+)
MDESTPPRRREIALALVSCALSVCFTNYCLVLGYFVQPISTSCPGWTKSTISIGFSLSFAAHLFSSPWIAPQVEKGNLRAWTVVQIVLFGIGYCTSGLCAGACDVSPVATEIFFLLSFVPMAIASTLGAFVVTFYLFRLLSRKHRGFASTYYGAVATTGSLIFTQIVLWGQQLVQEKKITFRNAVFLCWTNNSSSYCFIITLLHEPFP